MTQPTLDSSLLGAWRQLLLNRATPFARQQADGSYRWQYDVCDLAVLNAHLLGSATIAVSSADARGWCKWICVDVDGPDTWSHLVTLQRRLVAQALPCVLESSRRGGHLWFHLQDMAPAAIARAMVQEALEQLRRNGVVVPTYELYPETTAAGALAHAVRLPLGIHQLSRLRYPFLDATGQPQSARDVTLAVQTWLAQPRIPARQVQQHVAQGAPSLAESLHPARTAHALTQPPEACASSETGNKSTTSPVIRWVDAHVSLPNLLAELAPATELRAVGRGFLGWCPFHDDRAPDSDGAPGTRSFYVVHDDTFGWSWRCFSTNCTQSRGPLRHTFQFFEDILAIDARAAIGEALRCWPDAGQTRTDGRRRYRRRQERH